ncbi:MAG: hypothetical protein K8U57_33125 [Planctomycetes bacterium]|nr:hypothetical protein [Planctomycetota bacterium]
MNPRRILLLVGGFAAFAAAYLIYAQMFGWLDGLPILPPKMLIASDGTFQPPERLTSPTIELIKQAFGDKCPETEPTHYPNQLRFQQGDTTMVIAAGSLPSNPNSNRIMLSPFSVAMFSKPRPKHLQQPGEVTEVSTIHSDRAVLEFDRVIQSATEMNNAKLVRLELISDAEQAVQDAFKREGKVHVTNNQRSADPNRRLVLRTVGPLFYRDPKVPAGAPPLTGPDIWTDSPVEIVDRSNLPRQPGEPAAAAPATAEEVRNDTAVAAILGGKRLPPPTITAVGMRVYLEQQNQPGKPPAPKKPAGSGPAGVGGVQRVEFTENVVMNLWVDGGQGLVGSGDGKSAVAAETTSAMSAVGGGFINGANVARAFGRDLLQVETRGPFVYDSQKNLARFDVLPLADPNLRNDVQVTKVASRPGRQTLFSQVLEIEFEGSPEATPAGSTPTTVALKPAGNPATAAPGQGPGSSKFKRLHAWTYTQGRFLTVSSDGDQLEAYGQDLTHDTVLSRTRLTGSPLYAIQQRNVLTAGAAKQPAVLIIDQPPNPPELAAQPRRNQATVIGPGRVEIFDAASNTTSITASWLTSMVQSKEKANDLELDLYTFTDGAKFEDVKSDFWLKGKVLKLWLAPTPSATTPSASATPAAASSAAPARNQPHRLQALGDVTGHSADMDIEQSDHLNTLFRDVPPPAVEPPPVAPVAKGPVNPMVAPTPTPTPAPKEPEKPKPPLKLRARTIETWVVRYPQPKPPGQPAVAPKPAPAQPGARGTEQTSGGMKYQLDKARCEGMVSVHQDPADATKPRGTDILGSRMLIDSTPDGSILTVFGWDDRPGEVHNEGTSLIGPKVLIDQLHNLAVIEGRGSLVMPTSSDLSGNSLKQPEVIVIHFRDGMKFQGAKKVADFFGKVTAAQGVSWVTCHTLQVNFDRPVYLSQANRPKPVPGAKPEEGPKLDVVYCYPAPGDAADSPQEKQVYFNQVDTDPISNRPIRRQQIIARELTLRAQARESGNAEPYKLLLAAGPGEVRTWQPGSKDDGPAGPVASQPAVNPMEAQPAAPPEMKLTIIRFAGRMIGKDKGAVYKEATFLDPVEVFDIPTDNPELQLERHKMPPRSTFLSCAKQLVVWSHTKPKEPTEQHMKATGNAYMRNDEYDGWGETIEVIGKLVTFEGMESVPARIKSRFTGNDQTGKKIKFDRATNHYTVEGSVGGTLTESPGPAKKNPSPKK